MKVKRVDKQILLVCQDEDLLSYNRSDNKFNNRSELVGWEVDNIFHYGFTAIGRRPLPNLDSEPYKHNILE